MPTIKDIALCAFCCLFSPIVCMLSWRFERDPGYDKPAALKLRSRRPVTPPLPEPSILSLRRKQNYEEQAESPIFSRLPPELRLMIWQLCLADTVHIVWKKGHLAGGPCISQDGSGDDGKGHEICYRQMNRYRGPLRASSPAQSRGRIALLLTCRRM